MGNKSSKVESFQELVYYLCFFIFLKNVHLMYKEHYHVYYNSHFFFYEQLGEIFILLLVFFAICFYVQSCLFLVKKDRDLWRISKEYVFLTAFLILVPWFVVYLFEWCVELYHYTLSSQVAANIKSFFYGIRNTKII